MSARSITPVPSPSSLISTQEQVPSPSSFHGDAPTVNPPPVNKRAGNEEKVQEERVKEEVGPAELLDPTDPHLLQYLHVPHPETDLGPEPEDGGPADPRDLETLDATAKMLFKGDREIIGYIEALNHRTAAILEHVNRKKSELLSCKESRERIKLFVDNLRKTIYRGTHGQLLGEALNPDLPPMAIPNENEVVPTVGEHPFENEDYADLPYDDPRELPAEFARQSPSHLTGEDIFRFETPPARRTSLPTGYEDENGLEYVEEVIERCSDFPAPPDHAALASDDSTFDRSGVNLRITSDTGLLFPPPDEELARISMEFRRGAMSATADPAVRPPTNLPHLRHPLAQSHIPPSSPEVEHLVPPRPVFRTPPPSRIVPTRKRKRASTPDDEDDRDDANLAGPSTAAVRPDENFAWQTEARNKGGRISAKRPRLVSQEPTWDYPMLLEAGYAPALPRVDPPTRENSLEPSSQPLPQLGPFLPIGTPQVQEDGPEIEMSQVTEIPNRVAERSGSEGEIELTGKTSARFGVSRDSLPALTADNSQVTSAANTQPELVTPARSQASANVPAPIPEDVFGPIVPSVKANKISGGSLTEVPWQEVNSVAVASGSGHEAANVSRKSTRFSLDGETEKKERKVYRKTPIKPRTSLRVIEAEDALAAEIEAEGRDSVDPLPSRKKKRAGGARVRKQKTTSPVEPEPTTNPGVVLPSISTSNPPAKLRRGRSASTQSKLPSLKAPLRRSARNKK